ncbi:hypothetical protein [Maricaulis maris]|uniref:Lipoprotein n=1 Tax=Maricaulis maris TaxID=74318 RepID=A0A495DM90_9PROT|nr:hypothetical protein [Maricaulis maris]RKR04038.1 hypothetical protein C7435_0481 [Maricaulis maris]
MTSHIKSIIRPTRIWLAVLTIGLFVSGCTTSEPLTSPDGLPGFSIDCSSGRWSDCYEEASRLCPQGYIVIDRVGDTDTHVSEMDGDLSFQTMVSRELMIECR